MQWHEKMHSMFMAHLSANAHTACTGNHWWTGCW